MTKEFFETAMNRIKDQPNHKALRVTVALWNDRAVVIFDHRTSFTMIRDGIEVTKGERPCQWIMYDDIKLITAVKL